MMNVTKTGLKKMAATQMTANEEILSRANRILRERVIELEEALRQIEELDAYAAYDEGGEDGPMYRLSYGDWIMVAEVRRIITNCFPEV